MPGSGGSRVMHFTVPSETVSIAAGDTGLAGVLQLTPAARGIVLYVRRAERRQPSHKSDGLANALHHAGMATLLLDAHDFDPAQHSARLTAAADWLAAQPKTKKLGLGLYAAGSEAAAALQLAVRRPVQVAAVVAYAGRPDLAGTDTLARVSAPTLLIVDEQDDATIEFNRYALDRLGGEKDLAVIRGTTHALGATDALKEVARLATRWFAGYFGGDASYAIRNRM